MRIIESANTLIVRFSLADFFPYLAPSNTPRGKAAKEGYLFKNRIEMTANQFFQTTPEQTTASRDEKAALKTRFATQLVQWSESNGMSRFYLAFDHEELAK